MNNWYDSNNPTTVVRGGTWRAMVWVIAVLIFVGLIGIAMWGFGVFSSPIKGRGDAFKQQQSSENRIAAQARFEDLYAEIKATDAKLLPAKMAAKSNPSSQVKATEYTGLVNYCVDVVADYNAEARKYLAADFRAFDLPAQIDSLDSSTDCKP